MKRRKQHLIPFEESKRIIHLEQRGKVKKYNGCITVFAILGILCLLYCFSIALFMGYGTGFFLIWGVMAIVFGGLSVLFAHPKWLANIPRWIRWSAVICCMAGLGLFGTVEGMILGQFNAEASSGADYMIVLGAQWKTSGPSYVLQKRLDKAMEYLQENPDTIVIVSGGQGSNEPITEAAGMKGYLEEKGIASERILAEDKSTNTYENLVFSAELLDKENSRVVLVTNNFHVFRTCSIAKMQGYTQIEGLAADSYPAMIPNNLLREFFGVVKDFALGNL